MAHTLWYSQTGQSLNLRRKVTSQYGVCNTFLPETTTCKKRFPELECESRHSVTMIAKNEKLTTEISCPFTHFSEI